MKYYSSLLIALILLCIDVMADHIINCNQPASLQLSLFGNVLPDMVKS
jgi:hypothetical protein